MFIKRAVSIGDRFVLIEGARICCITSEGSKECVGYETWVSTPDGRTAVDLIL